MQFIERTAQASMDGARCNILIDQFKEVSNVGTDA